MSLVLVRVDDRLVHGQVMVGWRSHLGATQVLVASDRLCANPMACNVLRLTAPPEVDLIIDSVEGMTRRIMAGEFDRQKDILLFENLGDILRALDLGVIFDHLNVGGIRHQECRIALTPSVSLSEEDIGTLRKIMERGIPVDIQMLPREESIAITPEQLERRAR